MIHAVNEMLRWKESASCQKACVPAPVPTSEPTPKLTPTPTPVPLFPETSMMIPLPEPPAPEPVAQEPIRIPDPTPRPPDNLDLYNQYLGIQRPPPYSVEGFTTQTYQELETTYQEMIGKVNEIRQKNIELRAKIAREENIQRNISKKESVQSGFEELYKVATQRNESYQKMFMTLFSVVLFLIVVTVIFYQLFYPRS